MHAKGHVGYSQASFMSNYMQVRSEVMNIPLQLNAVIVDQEQRLINESKAYGSLYIFVYLCTWRVHIN